MSSNPQLVQPPPLTALLTPAQMSLACSTPPSTIRRHASPSPMPSSGAVIAAVAWSSPRLCCAAPLLLLLLRTAPAPICTDPMRRACWAGSCFTATRFTPVVVKWMRGGGDERRLDGTFWRREEGGGGCVTCPPQEKKNPRFRSLCRHVVAFVSKPGLLHRRKPALPSPALAPTPSRVRALHSRYILLVCSASPLCFRASRVGVGMVFPPQQTLREWSICFS